MGLLRHGGGSACSAVGGAMGTAVAAFLLVLGAASRTHAQTVVVCEAASESSAAVETAIRDALAGAPEALVPRASFEVASCSSLRATIVVTLDGIVIRAVVAIEPNAPLPAADIAAASRRAFDTLARTVTGPPRDANGSAPNTTVTTADAPSTEPAPGEPLGAPQALARPPTRAESAASHAEERGQFLALGDERRAFAFDLGLRLYQHATGAYALRFRITWPHAIFEYRYATITLTGIVAGDEVKMREQTVGGGVRQLVPLGRRAGLELAALADLGVVLARGKSDSGGSITRAGGACAIDLRVDATFLVPIGRLRLRFGIDGAIERGLTVYGSSGATGRQRLGGFDGFVGGFHAGLGFGQPRREGLP